MFQRSDVWTFRQCHLVQVCMGTSQTESSQEPKKKLTNLRRSWYGQIVDFQLAFWEWSSLRDTDSKVDPVIPAAWYLHLYTTPSSWVWQACDLLQSNPTEYGKGDRVYVIMCIWLCCIKQQHSYWKETLPCWPGRSKLFSPYQKATDWG